MNAGLCELGCIRRSSTHPKRIGIYNGRPKRRLYLSTSTKLIDYSTRNSTVSFWTKEHLVAFNREWFTKSFYRWSYRPIKKKRMKRLLLTITEDSYALEVQNVNSKLEEYITSTSVD